MSTVSLLVALLLSQAAAPPAAGRISGRVMAEGTNAPIAGARLMLMPSGRPNGPMPMLPQALTGQDGRPLPYAASLAARAARLGLSGAVRLTGLVQGDQAKARSAIAWDDRNHRTERLHLGAREPLTREVHPARDGLADEPTEVTSTPVHAHAQLGEAEHRVVRGDDEVARRGDRDAGAERGTRDRTDDWDCALLNREERLEGIMGDDGITNCGNAQNCVKVCPMNIPLTKAIYEENRETVLYGLLGWLKK